MAILSINSHVVLGRVGNRVALPAFEALGVESWPLPSVIFSHTPSPRGHAGGAVPFDLLAEIFSRLEGDGTAALLKAIHIGYMPDARLIARAAQFIAAIKTQNPAVIFSLDPVLGDDGRLYVPEASAHATKSLLVPLANILTPNAFELGWLTRARISDTREAGVAAESLGLDQVLVTSVPAGLSDEIGTLLIEFGNALLVTTPQLSYAPHGTGDLMAALYLARRTRGEGAMQALEAACASVFWMVAHCQGSHADELPILNNYALLASPEITFRAKII